MAGIKEPLKDVLTQLAAIQVENRDNYTVPLFARVFNNQMQYEAEGKYQAYSKPAAFVEVVNNAVYQEIGKGYASCDLVFRVHLVHEFLNEETTFEQDLGIFDLRDKVIVALSHYRPTGCGPLVRIAEAQQYDHDNVYVYVVEFMANFTDSKGSPYDEQAGKYIDTTDPVTLNTEVTIETSPVNLSSKPYRIPQ